MSHSLLLVAEPICLLHLVLFLRFFFFNETATTEIYTLSLHDALPIWNRIVGEMRIGDMALPAGDRDVDHRRAAPADLDRKSTRLNSSHVKISYAVFCLKKKINKKKIYRLEKTTHNLQRSPCSHHRATQ